MMMIHTMMGAAKSISLIVRIGIIKLILDLPVFKIRNLCMIIGLTCASSSRRRRRAGYAFLSAYLPC